MGKSVKSNYIYNLLYEILAIIVPLITTPYVSRVLGATAIGDYNYTAGIVTYFGLIAALGTATYANREIAVCQSNRDKRSFLFWEIFIFRILSMIIALLAYLIFIFNFLSNYRLLFLIHLFTVLSWIVDISWFCQGMENFKVTAIRNSVVKLISTLMIFFFIKSPDDLWLYTLIQCVAMLFGNLTMWAYAIEQIRFVRLKEIQLLKHAKSIFQLFIPVIAIQVYTVLDKTMLGALVNTTEVGYYAQAEKIERLALTVISSFIVILLPRFSVIYKESKELLKDFIGKSLNYIFMLSLPMMVGCILVIDEFVPVFFGDGYEPVSRIIQVLSLLYVIVSLGKLFGTLLVAVGQQSKYSVAVVVAAIVNLILNLIFIRAFNGGALGVSVASVISELVATSIQLYYIRDIIGIKQIAFSAFKYVLPTTVMATVIIVLRFIIGESFVAFIIQLCTAVGVYFVFLLIKKDSIVTTVFNQAFEKFKKVTK